METRTSRTLGALALVGGGLAITLGSLFEPTQDGDSVATTLAKIASHRTAQRATLVADLAAVLILPAVLLLARLAHRRAPRLAVVGGSLAVAGWFAGIAAFGGLDIVLYHAALAPIAVRLSP